MAYQISSADWKNLGGLTGKAFGQPLSSYKPMQIAGSIFFVETKLIANSIVKQYRELMGLFGYKKSDLQVSAE